MLTEVLRTLQDVNSVTEGKHSFTMINSCTSHRKTKLWKNASPPNRKREQESRLPSHKGQK
jgi:hypothetical protein